MTRLAVLSAILLISILTGCGTSSRSNSATGAWAATLSGPSAQSLGSFSFTLNQTGLTLTGNNMNFSGMGSLSGCFGSGTTITGQMNSGMMNGGSMMLTMTWTAPGGGTNTLTMQGNMGSGMMSGSGTFTLMAQTAGCMNESGTFTMSHTSSGMM